MGYSIYLIDREKSITTEVVDEIIKQLPNRLLGFGSGSKQSGGWKLVTDLSIREKTKQNYLIVSGSFSVSGKWALDMVVAFQQLLQRKGYKIEIFSTDFGFCNKELYEWMENDPNELKSEENF